MRKQSPLPAWISTLLFVLVMGLPFPVSAEDAKPEDAKPAEKLLAGHSQHGEVFNEGPRQKAYLMPGTGKVHFPATTKNAEAQAFINQGVGQLHGFWYFEAERSFRQAAALDPTCAIAYWGMSRANIENEKRAKGFIAQAVKRKASASPHEQLYIDAMDAYLKADSKKKKPRAQAYVAALEQILDKYPDDIEARAFLGLQLWQNAKFGIPITSHYAVDALLKQVLAVEPMHPCHHYLIHLWDAKRAENALPSAALCGQSAPGIAHMWHMPGHIYSKVRRYADAAWQQEASARVDHAHMMRDRVLPDQIHNFAHNNEWLIRDLSHIGRVHDALDLAQNMISLPRHPKYNTLSKHGSTYYGRLRLLEVLNRYELWDRLIAFARTRYLEPTDDRSEQIKRLRYLGRAWFSKGDRTQGLEILAQLEDRLFTLSSEQKAAVAKAETKAREDKKRDKQISEAKAAASKKYEVDITGLENAIAELLGYVAIAGGDYKTGLALLKKAGGIEDPVLVGLHLKLGQKEEAERLARKSVSRHKEEVLPLAHLVLTEWELGKKEDAKKTFTGLRELAGSMELDLPVCRRLAPIAKELGWGADWRIVKPAPADVGNRPALDSLGPFRWQPSPAADWELTDARGERHSLADYRGKPVVVIFYLGYGCLHCAQQLQAFAPKAQAFADAGIQVIAISTDDQAGLKQSLANYKEAFPYPLVSNSTLEVFKEYRVYDDFENQPLHGTFLIDEQGLVRWQDISFEPFMEVDFLLQEAGRQLAQPVVKTARAK